MRPGTHWVRCLIPSYKDSVPFPNSPCVLSVRHVRRSLWNNQKQNKPFCSPDLTTNHFESDAMRHSAHNEIVPLAFDLGGRQSSTQFSIRTAKVRREA